MAISAVMIAATVGGTVLDILYEDDGETETMYQAFQKDKAYQKALEGKIIDQELLEETMAVYGTIPKDVERYSQTEEYEAYARPYSAIFQYQDSYGHGDKGGQAVGGGREGAVRHASGNADAGGGFLQIVPG